MHTIQVEGGSLREVAPHIMPDLMAEYSSEYLTLYGVTGTPSELLKMCPVPHEAMTLEAKNNFLAMAMNESGSAIKKEHIPYVQKVVESRGVELKVTVRETPPTSEIADCFSEYGKNHKVSQNSEGLDTLIDPVEREVFRNSTIDTPSLKKIETKVMERAFDSATDETTTDQMDMWLTQIHQEYEVHKLRLEEKTISPLPIKVGTNSTTKGESAFSATSDTAAIPLKISSEVFIPSSSARQIIVENKVPNSREITPSAQTATTPSEHDKIDAFPDNHAPFHDFSTEYGSTGIEPDVDITSMESIDFSTVSEPLDIDFKVLAENDRHITLDELLPDFECENESDVPDLLTDQIMKYVEVELAQPEIAKATVILITEIKSIAYELAELQDDTDEEKTDEVNQLLRSLEEVCVELLDKLGIIYDEETKWQFIQTMISQLALVSIKTTDVWQLSEKEGTHEHKAFIPRSWTHVLQKNMTNFHVLGRYAVTVSLRT